MLDHQLIYLKLVESVLPEGFIAEIVHKEMIGSCNIDVLSPTKNGLLCRAYIDFWDDDKTKITILNDNAKSLKIDGSIEFEDDDYEIFLQVSDPEFQIKLKSLFEEWLI